MSTQRAYQIDGIQTAVSAHARDRWHERTGTPRGHCDRAFRDSHRVPGAHEHPHFRRGDSPDPEAIHAVRVRTVAGTIDVVFVVVAPEPYRDPAIDRVVSTCYPRSSIEDPEIAAYVEALCANRDRYHTTQS